jgi:hypothetical protein
MKINHRENPIPRRRASYPSITDQIDAIYKGFKDLEEQGFKFNEETKGWMRAVSEVKATFPVSGDKPPANPTGSS